MMSKCKNLRNVEIRPALYSVDTWRVFCAGKPLGMIYYGVGAGETVGFVFHVAHGYTDTTAAQLREIADFLDAKNKEDEHV